MHFNKLKNKQRAMIKKDLILKKNYNKFKTK